VASTALDDTDFRILNLLRENGRASYAQLGEAVGLSPHGTADRVRRLERAGIITGFTITVAQDGVGRGLDAFVDVSLGADQTPEAFEKTVSALPAVREMAFVTGRFDYHIRVNCRDADDLDKTVRTIRREGGAAQTETRIVLRASAPMHPLD
jgi:Lrp/AsnC family transcriptional regulator, leucine-responsive regulatory protein